MTKCEHYDCGWCYALDTVKTNSYEGSCIEPKNCPYLHSQMTKDIKKFHSLSTKSLII